MICKFFESSLEVYSLGADQGTAQPSLFLEQGDLMSLSCRRDCRLHTSGAAAHHDHLSLVGPMASGKELQLPADHRVYRAGDGPGGHQAALTLQAAQARCDILPLSP